VEYPLLPVPGTGRHYPGQLQHPEGTRKGGVGWIVANSVRESWDVWLDVRTGEGRLRRQRD
jgi:hypothetical protein